MGGGNVQKSATKRARNLAKAGAEGKSTSTEDRKKQQASANANQCVKCMQTFSNTVRQPELEQHVDSKHSKGGITLKDCFPNWTIVS